MKAARPDRDHHRHHRRLPRRDRGGLPGHASARRAAAVRQRLHLPLLEAPQHPGRARWTGQLPERVKEERNQDPAGAGRQVCHARATAGSSGSGSSPLRGAEPAQCGAAGRTHQDEQDRDLRRGCGAPDGRDLRRGNQAVDRAHALRGCGASNVTRQNGF